MKLLNNEIKVSNLILIVAGSVCITLLLSVKYFNEIVIFPLNKINYFTTSNLNFKTLDSQGKHVFLYFYKYDCKYCKSIQSDIENVYLKYKNDYKFYFINVVDFNDNKSLNSVLASRCAFYEDKFLPYNRLLFDRYLNQDLDYIKLASYANIENGERFQDCLGDSKTLNDIKKIQKVTNYYEVGETPSIIINGYMIKGTVDVGILKAILDELGK